MNYLKPIIAILSIAFFSPAYCQMLSLEDLEFVSRNNDTVQAELGAFQVPENRAKPDGKQLTLKFVRFRSTNPNPGSPIVYLAGGPGGSGSGTARGARFSLFMKLRGIADVIAFDQRGTGYSKEIPDCPITIKLDPSEALSQSEYAKRSIANLKECMAFWEKEGHDLSAYNSTESAADIEDLRKALDLDKISLWGISYGSHLAFEFIKQYESSLDKVVLASLEGPDETIKLPKYTDSFLERLAERATTNYGQENTYPDFLMHMRTVHERLAKESIQTPYRDRSGKEGMVGISLFELQMTIAGIFLKNPDNSQYLPIMYKSMYEGNFQQTAKWIAGMKGYVANSKMNGMSLAMDLQSGVSTKRAKMIKEQIPGSYLGTINAMDFDWIQAGLLEQLPDTYRKLPKNQVKTLLLSGDLDGRTYIEAAKEIAKAFKKGTHVIIENAGHDLYMTDPSVGQLVFDFFAGKPVEIEKLRVPPVPFR